MSNPLADSLTKEKIQQLFAAAGPRTAEDTSQINAVDYNWYQPHYFTSEQLKKLEDFTKKAAILTDEKFSALCHSNFNTTIISTTQHFADEFLMQPPESHKNNYCLAFGAEKVRTCGLVAIPNQTAAAWVTQLLGDTESEKDLNRTLSQLEESLLLDASSAIIDAFFGAGSGCNSRPARSLVRGQLPLELQNAEELCKIVFRIAKAQSTGSNEAYILIACKEMEIAIGKTSQVADKFSAEDISKAIMNSLYKMPVSVTGQLASIILTFKEIINLQADDIILLDKKVDEPLDLIIDGRAFFHGKPAKSAGSFAVVITEPFHNTT
jgi:flagellar motor switch protein FliM